MKQTYIKPTTATYTLCAESMLATSITVHNDDTTTVTASDALSRDNSVGQWDSSNWE